MRRINPYLAAVLAAGSLAFTLPAAQAHSMHGHGALHGQDMRGGLRGLDLSDAQREQVRSIFKEQATAMRERMEIARKAHQELRAASLAPSFDGARVRELADTAAKALADAAVLRAEAMSKVVALLTPEQRARLEERRAKLDERRQRGEQRGQR
jgi:protein CpxP